MSRARTLAARCAASPFLATLGATVRDAGVERVHLALDRRPQHANRNGTLHGGAIASLLAAAAGLASVDGDGPEALLVDLAIAYLAVGRDGPFGADARLLRRGRAIVHVDARVHDADGLPLASALAVLRRGRPAAPPTATVALAGEPPAEPLGVPFPSASPFSAHLGVAVVHRQAGRGVAVLRHDTALYEADGTIATGALATLVDAAAGASAWSVAGFDPRRRAATLAMHLTPLTPCRDEDVVAEAVALPSGGDCHVCTVRLWGRHTRVQVASASATYRIARAP